MYQVYHFKAAFRQAFLGSSDEWAHRAEYLSYGSLSIEAKVKLILSCIEFKCNAGIIKVYLISLF